MILQYSGVQHRNPPGLIPLLRGGHSRTVIFAESKHRIQGLVLGCWVGDKAAAAGRRAQIHLRSGVCPAISACRRQDHQRPVTWRRGPANHRRRPGPAADANGMWLAVLSLFDVEGFPPSWVMLLSSVALSGRRRKAKSRICIRICILWPAWPRPRTGIHSHISCIPESNANTRQRHISSGGISCWCGLHMHVDGMSGRGSASTRHSHTHTHTHIMPRSDSECGPVRQRELLQHL